MKMKTAHGAQKFSHVFIKSWARPNGEIATPQKWWTRYNICPSWLQSMVVDDLILNLPYKVILQGDGKLYWDVHAAIIW